MIHSYEEIKELFSVLLFPAFSLRIPVMACAIVMASDSTSAIAGSNEDSYIP